MKVQLILLKKSDPIRFDKAKMLEISNKSGLKIMGMDYSEMFPLEKIKALMVVE